MLEVVNQRFLRRTADGSVELSMHLNVLPGLILQMPMHAVEKAIVKPTAAVAVRSRWLDEPPPSTRTAASLSQQQNLTHVLIIDAAFYKYSSARTARTPPACFLR